MENNKEEENLFPINLMVLKEHYRETLIKYLEKNGCPYLLIDPELKLNIEYVLNPLPKDNKIISGLSILHDDFEKEFEKIKVEAIKTVVFIIKPRIKMVERAS